MSQLNKEKRKTYLHQKRMIDFFAVPSSEIILG